MVLFSLQFESNFYSDSPYKAHGLVAAEASAIDALNPNKIPNIKIAVASFIGFFIILPPRYIIRDFQSMQGLFSDPMRNSVITTFLI